MQSKIKILYLVPSLRKTSPISGTLALIKYIDRDLCDLTVACLDSLPRGTSLVVDELKKINIKIKLLDLPGWFGLLNIKKLKAALKFIKGERFDVIHSYGIRPDIINSVIKDNNISVSSVREILGDGYRLQYGPMIAAVFSFIHLRALRKIDYIIVIADAIKRHLVKNNLDTSKIYYIPNFIDLEWMGQEEHLNYELDEKNINIGYFGYFIPLKRIDWIIMSVSDLFRKYLGIKITLHLVGEGQLFDKLKKMANDLGLSNNVRFHGYVKNVTPIMKKMDLVVMASESEGIPRVLMEAMSMGKTCIGPKIGGVDELIQDNVTGYLFDPNSYADLAKKMEDVIIKKRYLDPNQIKKYIKDNFAAENGAKKTLELYQYLLAGHAQ